MTYIETLEKFGHIIQEYFEYITPQDEKYYLLVDEFLFESFLDKMQKQYKVSAKDVYAAYKNVKCKVHGNPYAALAIASYQVMIFYTLETNCDSDAYNEKLFSSVAYSGLAYPDYWYQDTKPYAPSEGCAYQEKLWKIVADSFRISSIPEHTSFGAHDRYVQYPASQNPLYSSMRTFRIRFADRFKEIGLEPNQGITFEIFEGLVFNRAQYNDIDDPMLRRLVFSFYCMWDGRSFCEILARKKVITREEMEQKAKEEFLIQIEPEIKLYVNKKTIDLYKDNLNDKYLWRLDENKYLTRRGTYFIKDSDYNDWLPYNRAIDADDEVLILTTQTKYPTYIENLRKNDEIEVLEAGLYKILILRLKNRDSFENFRIPVKIQPYFSLVGGLKIKRNTYYPFALPSVVFSEHKYNEIKYNSVFLDSEEYPIVNGIAQLPEKLKPGKHCLKLLNSWDSSEMFFSVDAVSVTPGPEVHGWVLNEEEKELNPSTNMEDTVIDGLSLKGELKWIGRKLIHLSNGENSNLRPFLHQIDRLENRLIYRNKKFIKRGNYEH